MSAPRRLILADDPHRAAAVYLATLAYPERAAAAARDRFALALHDHHVHHVAEQQGRPAALSLRSPGDDRPIQHRAFAGRLDRGFDRVRRSLAVLELYGLRQSHALCTFRAPKTGRVRASSINRAMPCWTELLRESPESWKAVFALNVTGPGARDEREIVRKVLRRVIYPCSAVLHLAYGLAAAAPEPIDGTPEAIKAQLWQIALHPQSWLVEAVDRAQFYPHRPYPRGGEAQLRPAAMIEVLWRSREGEIIRPDTLPLTRLPPRRTVEPRRCRGEPAATSPLGAQMAPVGFPPDGR